MPDKKKKHDKAETEQAPEAGAERPQQDAPKQDVPQQDASKQETPKQETPGQETPGQDAPKQDAPQQEAPKDDSAEKLAAAEDRYLRLAAEYDNYRKRTAREKESAWADSRMQTVAAFLPVYDNLERALKQETADSAFKKGVEMTMKGLQDALTGLGVETIPAMGETFDPHRHNAAMHVEDGSVGENTIVDVFQQGFMCGDKVIRFAMVKVAN